MLLKRDESFRKDRSILLDLYCFTFTIDVKEFWRSCLEKNLSGQRKQIEFSLKQSQFEGLNGVMAIGYGKLFLKTND